MPSDLALDSDAKNISPDAPYHSVFVMQAASVTAVELKLLQWASVVLWVPIQTRSLEMNGCVRLGQHFSNVRPIVTENEAESPVIHVENESSQGVCTLYSQEKKHGN